MAVGIGEALDSAWMRMGEILNVDTLSHPQLFRVTLLLVVGFVGGKIFSEVMLRLLRMTSLDEMGVKSNIQVALRKLSYRGSLSEFVADVTRWAIYMLTLLALSSIFGSDMAAQYSELGINLASRVVAATLILAFGAIISERIGSIVVHVFRFGRISGRVDESHAEVPLYIITGKAVRYFGYLVTFLITLGFIGVDAYIIYILVGIIGAGIVAAFVMSSYHVLRNILISMYFQASHIFRGGEQIRIGDYQGRIESIRPLHTEIKHEGNIYYIPNTKLVSDVIEYKGE